MSTDQHTLLPIPFFTTSPRASFLRTTQSIPPDSDSDSGAPACLNLVQGAALFVEIRDQFARADVLFRIVHSVNSTSTYELEASLPLHAHSVVRNVELFTHGQHLKCKVERASIAEDMMDDALASGRNAFMMKKQGKEFVFSLGQIAPGEEIFLKFELVWNGAFNVERNAFEHYIPVHLVSTPSNFFLEKLESEDGAETPFGMIPLEGSFVSISYGMSLQYPVASVSCFSDHLLSFEIPNENGVRNSGHAVLLGADPSKISSTIDLLSFFALPLELRIELARTLECTDLVSVMQIPSSSELFKTSYSCAGSIRIVPSLFPCVDSLWKADVDSAINTEAFFVLDCSGSMQGAPIEESKRAMLLFLKSLPVGIHFNLVQFGTRHEFLFVDGCRSFDEESCTIATQHVQGIQANFGGTNLLSCLNSIFSLPRSEGRVRTLFILTDGCVSDMTGTIQAVTNHANSCRVFSIGIGNQVSFPLVSGLARAGHGIARFVSSNSSEMTSTVVQMLRVALEPALTDIQITLTPKELNLNASVVVCSENIPPSYPSQSEEIYFFSSKDAFPMVAHIEAQYLNQRISEDIKIEFPQFSQEQVEFGSDMLHVLSAQQRISSLEEHSSLSSNQKDEIILLGKSFRLPTSQTTLIVVDAFDRPPNESAPILHRISFGVAEEEERSNTLRKRVSSGRMSIQSRSSLVAIPCASRSSLGRDQPIRKPEKRVKMAMQGCGIRSEVTGGSSGMMPQSGYLEQELDMDWYSSKPSFSGAASLGPLSNPSTPSSSHDYLIANQAFSGSWNDFEVLREFVSNLETVLGGIPENVDMICWTTACVLGVFEMRFSSARSEWNLVYDKAIRFLNKNLTCSDSIPSSHALVTYASRLIQLI